MLHKTRGVVLHSIKYSETSIIVKIFTESSGLVSYLVKSARSKKSKMKTGLFQPLTLLEFVAYHKKKTGLQIIKEIVHCHHFTGIPCDIKKSSVAIFMAEVLYKSIREEEQNIPLFEFISGSVEMLDNSEGRISEFHIYFLIELSKFLGFYPQKNYSDDRNIFNLYDGQFQEDLPEHQYYIEKEVGAVFFNLLETSLNKRSDDGLVPEVRKILLYKILDYYRIHLSGFNTLRSLAILEEVFK